MEELSRSRRSLANKVGDSRRSALEELTALRLRQKSRAPGSDEDVPEETELKKPLSRLDQYNLKLEEDVYDVIPESDYAALVAKRRESMGEFIVGVDDFGYADIGEEEDWDTANHCEDSGEEDNLDDGKKKKGTVVKPKKDVVSRASQALSQAAKLHMPHVKGVSNMFAAAAIPVANKRTGKIFSSTISDAEAEKTLDNILAGVTVATKEKQLGRLRRRGPGLPSRLSSFRSDGVLGSKQTSRLRGKTGITKPLTQDFFQQEDLLAVQSVVEPVQELSAEGNLEDLVIHTKNSPDLVDSSKEKEPVTVLKNQKTVKTGLNAKISVLKGEENASAAWQAVFQEEGQPENEQKVEEVTTAVEEAKESISVEGKLLSLDGSGKLPFFFLDAFEEPYGGMPGTVFLFGKVLMDNNYVSCCCVVRNIQRCIYAVPQENIFQDSILPELEEKVNQGDEKAKLELMKKLQALAKNLKEEVGDLLLERDVSSFTMSPVKRTYAFERNDVPQGTNYFLKVSYPFKDVPLPSDSHGHNFSSLFGTHTSALELLLLKRKVMGPSWLLISNPQVQPSGNQLSHCRVEISVNSPKDLSPSSESNRESPPLIVASLNLKTVINHKQNVNEVAAVSVVVCKDVKVDRPMAMSEWNTKEKLSHFSAIRRLEGGTFPVGLDAELATVNAKAGSQVVSKKGSERELLSFLLAKLSKVDADVLLGHNISGFDLDVLLHRLQTLKIGSWSSLGRLKRSQMPKLGGGGSQFGGGAGPGTLSCVAGRLICDTYLSSRELLKEVSYTLTQLAQSQLGRSRRELGPSEIPGMYESAISLVKLVELAETDAWLALGLGFHLSVLPLSKQLTNLSGNLWSKTLQGARAQRIEYLLLHEFHRRKFIVPDKLTTKEKAEMALKNNKRSTAGSKLKVELEDEALEAEEDPQIEESRVSKRKGPTYAGGLVLEPKKGLYDKFVVLLDFNSLYPSIIQEYNICFTTVERGGENGGIPSMPSSASPGILPQVLKTLVERRRQVKAMLKKETNPTSRQRLDIRQQALKLTANSMYGCLGFSNSRFFAKPLAEMITSQGREILQSTVNLVRDQLSFDVIYGDTDSIMVHISAEELSDVWAAGTKIKREVNKRYRLLEIEVDGIFRRMLLLKKKKYAAVKIEAGSNGSYKEIIEQKGLDMVRRDWSVVSKEVGNFCLEQILSGSPTEDVLSSIHSHLSDLATKMRSGEMNLDKFIITKTLTRPPQDYADAKTQPHVQVALRRRQAGHLEGTSTGDTVPYIICVPKNGSSVGGSLAERARHIDEVANGEDQWDVDIEYYLSQQIHPVVARLCAPIEGTDSARLADCLGLDSAKYRQQLSSAVDDNLVGSTSVFDDDERYRYCEPLLLTCPKCINTFPFEGLTTLTSSGSAESGQERGGEEVTSVVDKLLKCPCCENGTVGVGMLPNQVKQQVEKFVAKYYEGWAKCNDDMCATFVRDVSMRVSPHVELGSHCPTFPKCDGKVVLQYTEKDLYNQITHFHRLLVVPDAFKKNSTSSTILLALQQAREVVEQFRENCAFRWVKLTNLFG